MKYEKLRRVLHISKLVLYSAEVRKNISVLHTGNAMADVRSFSVFNSQVSVTNQQKFASNWRTQMSVAEVHGMHVLKFAGLK